VKTLERSLQVPKHIRIKEKPLNWSAFGRCAYEFTPLSNQRGVRHQTSLPHVRTLSEIQLDIQKAKRKQTQKWHQFLTKRNEKRPEKTSASLFLSPPSREGRSGPRKGLRGETSSSPPLPLRGRRADPEVQTLVRPREREGKNKLRRAFWNFGEPIGKTWSPREMVSAPAQIGVSQDQPSLGVAVIIKKTVSKGDNADLVVSNLSRYLISWIKKKQRRCKK
jgi:hypothetical protein